MGNVTELGGPAALQPRRLSDRMLAHVFAASLDESLAAGCPPESSRLLAARARDIVGLGKRRSLAGHWEHLLRVARRTPPGTWSHARQPAVPVCADEIVAAELVIRDLMTQLTLPLPVPARGVAMARALLTDPRSPVYRRQAAVALTAAVAAATAQLDPALPLMPSTPGLSA
jgi:hypothetical protein